MLNPASRSYVNKDRSITKKFVQHAEKRGIKALFITVDAPQLGRREKVGRLSFRIAPSIFVCPLPELTLTVRQDMRMKFDAEDPAEVTENKQGTNVDRSQGAARAISVSAGLRSALQKAPGGSFASGRTQSFIDPGLDWKDIPWFQSITKSASIPPLSPSRFSIY